MKREGGAPPFPRFQREGGDVDFISFSSAPKTKKPRLDFRNHQREPTQGSFLLRWPAWAIYLLWIQMDVHQGVSARYKL